MYLAESRIHFKQACIVSVIVDNFEKPLKQTEPAPFTELVINTVPITVASG